MTLRNRAGRRLGITDPAPDLSWSDAGDAYQVQLSDSASFASFLADSGRVPGAPLWVPWPGPELTSRQRVHWRVRVETGGSWGDWQHDWVEAGLLSSSDWTAVLIASTSEKGAPRFARAVELPAAPVHARLHVTALGVHEVTLGGVPVSDEVLAPGWTAYESWLPVDTYDVTELLHEGVNELAAVVGNGWWRGRIVSQHRKEAYGPSRALLLQLEITYADGTTVVAATGDGAWTLTHLDLTDDLYDGTHERNRHERSGAQITHADSLHGELAARTGPPVRRTETLAARPLGEGLYDAGQNLVGWLRLHLRTSESCTVTVRHAEVLHEGTLATAPLRSAKATDTWELSAGEHVLEPRFTFHGFRYAHVDTSAEVLAVEAVVVGSDLPPAAEFACSDPRLEQLHSNTVWSMRGNFLSVPTDCPQRDERLGWTGDIAVFAPTAALLADTHAFLRDWLRSLRAEQRPDGQVPVVVPDVLPPGGFAGLVGFAGWSDAAVLVPWWVAQRSGDLGVLRESLDSMRGWVDWVHGQCENGLWLREKQLGDWLDPAAPPENPWMASTDSGFVANALFVHSTRLLAASLELLGEDASGYGALAEGTAARAWARWGHHAVTTQTGCALALRYGLVPDTERVSVGAQLARLVEENGGRIGTGFLGTPEVLFALSDAGHVDAAYQLLLCTECPSWLYAVEHGATTIWERWDALRPDGTLNLGTGGDGGGGMLSFNHYAYGAVCTWLHEVAAGLTVRTLPEPVIRVAPMPGGGLTHARSEQSTPRGAAEVAWEISDGCLHVECLVPRGFRAVLAPPNGPTIPLPVGRSHHVLDLWS